MAARGRIVREGVSGTRADQERAEKERSRRRWDQTQGREERVQDEDGIDLRMEAPSNENWLDTIASRTQSTLTPEGQSLLTRLDMCEETKNKQREKLGADAVTGSGPGEEPSETGPGMGGAEDNGDALHQGDDGASSVGAASAGSLAEISGDVFLAKQGWDAVSACGGQRTSESIGIPESSEADLLEGKKLGFLSRMCNRIPVFDPTGVFRTAWDWFVIFLVIYVAVMVPVSACILTSLQKWTACKIVEGPDGSEEILYGTWEELYASPAWGRLAIFDTFVDSIFILDVFLNFNTGYGFKAHAAYLPATTHHSCTPVPLANVHDPLMCMTPDVP